MLGARFIRPGETDPEFSYVHALRDIVLPPGSDEARLHDAESRSIAGSAFVSTLPYVKAQNRLTERLVEVLAVRIAQHEGPGAPHLNFRPPVEHFVQESSVAQLKSLADAVFDLDVPLRKILARLTPAGFTPQTGTFVPGGARAHCDGEMGSGAGPSSWHISMD